MNAFDLDERVEAYESALIAGEAGLSNIGDYLPEEDAATRLEVLVELLRVTLEHQWQSGATDALAPLRTQFPEIFAAEEFLKPLAYEEYRLRAAEGQVVRPEDYHARYRIDVSDWPILSAENQSVGPGMMESDEWSEFSVSEPASATRLAASCRQMPNVGEHFGPFELTAVLGQGAFGKVFLAKQTTLANRLIALKIFPGVPVEADKLARLQHTNIVPVYSVHRRGKLSGVCMPYLGCVTLADLISYSRKQAASATSSDVLISTVAARQAELSTIRQTPASANATVAEPREMPPVATAVTRWGNQSVTEMFVGIASRIAAGLAHAHDHGIQHRDIKPANILISDDGEPLILDFNLADDHSSKASHMARLGGTLPYMSTEQLRQFQNQAPVDARSDIFSLGVVLYECLTQRHPFPIRRGAMDDVIREMLVDRNTTRPIPPSQFNRSVSPGLEAIVMKCLAANPVDRYASAGELHEDFERHLTDQPLRYVREVSLAEQARKWTKRHPKLSSATSVLSVALVVIAALVAGWLRRDEVIARKVASETLQGFSSQAAEVRSLLAMNLPGTDLEARGVKSTFELLQQYEVLKDSHWYDKPNVRKLEPAAKQKLAVEVVELLALLARHPTPQAKSVELTDTATRSWQKLTGTKLPINLLPTEASDSKLPPNLDEKDPAAGIKLLLATTDHLRRGQLAEARQAVEQFVKQHPRDEAAWLLLAHCFAEERDLISAEAAATASIALNEHSYLAWHMRGLLRFEAKRWQQASDDFSQAMQCRPNDPIAYFNRGLSRQALKQHTDAAADFTQAIELGLTETRVYFARARSWLALQRTKEAEADRQEGLARQPRDCLSWVERGLAKLETDPQAAASDLKEAVRLNPNSHFALINLSHVLSERLELTAEALVPLESLLRVTPQDRVARGSRAVLLARLERADEALDDVKVLLADKGEAFSYYQIACVFALLSKTTPAYQQQALALLQRALVLEPRLLDSMRGDADLKALHEVPLWQQITGQTAKTPVANEAGGSK